MVKSNIEFKSLEQYYQTKDFDKGIKWLLNNKDSYPLGQFYYNLGVLYTKQGDLAAGRYNFEKAIKEGYLTTSVYHNLEIAKSNLNVKELSNSQSLSDKVNDQLLSAPLDFYLIGSLFLIVIFSVLKRVNIIQKWRFFGIGLV